MNFTVVSSSALVIVIFFQWMVQILSMSKHYQHSPSINQLDPSTIKIGKWCQNYYVLIRTKGWQNKHDLSKLRILPAFFFTNVAYNLYMHHLLCLPHSVFLRNFTGANINGTSMNFCNFKILWVQGPSHLIFSGIELIFQIYTLYYTPFPHHIFIGFCKTGLKAMNVHLQHL